MVKPEFFDAAKQRFEGSSVKITDQGHRYLGSAIGQKSFVESFTNSCVNEWIKEVHQLSTFAESQPHAAFAALTHGLIGKWMFLARTTPDIAHLFEPLESTIRCELIPRLTGQGIPGTNDRYQWPFTSTATVGSLQLYLYQLHCTIIISTALSLSKKAKNH